MSGESGFLWACGLASLAHFVQPRYLVCSFKQECGVSHTIESGGS